jgi:hypothetical protein
LGRKPSHSRLKNQSLRLSRKKLPASGKSDFKASIALIYAPGKPNRDVMADEAILDLLSKRSIIFASRLHHVVCSQAKASLSAPQCQQCFSE